MMVKITKLYSKVFLFFGLFFFIFSVGLLEVSWLMVWNAGLLGSYDLEFLLVFDWVSVLFFSILCMIVSCVLKFSCVYMDDDMKEYRFILMLLSFVLSMSFLIFIPHFVFLLLGWDGLGLTSFLLVMYYSSGSSWSAALKTFLINRLGDAFFISCMVLLFSQGHWKIFAYDEYIFWLMMYLFVFGAFTKSAQYPFSSWLPAAMAAPTPVSALVHSSTLVTAGIYLLIRFSYLFSWSLHFVMGVFGLWTLYMASFSACVEWDAKKVIAYSTLSQLGLMCFSLGLGLSMFAFFHLLTHAVFKAMLFICVGYWISSKSHLQDLRGLKNLWYQNPLCAFSMLMSIFALSGFPFLAGFFSKDIMMESNLVLKKSFFLIMFLFSLPFTSFYSFRLFFWLLQKNFSSSSKGQKEQMVSFYSLFPLLVSSICLGYFLSQVFFIVVFPTLFFKIMILFLISFGWVLSVYSIFSSNKSLYWLWSNMFYIVPLKSSFFLVNFSNMGKYFYIFFDGGWGNLYSSSGKKFLKKLSGGFSRFLGYFFLPKFFFYLSSIIFLMVLLELKIFI